LPAAPAGKPARRRTARLAWALRTRWWPRFLLAGGLLVVIGTTLLGGAAGAWVAGAGGAIIFISAFWLLSMSPADYRREPPVPPGAGAAGSK
jgi:O-antigen/teichoic acid export membrane protein